LDLSISRVLTALANQRPLFHSEADFQHAIAWEIHKRLPRASVRLERPVEVSHLNKRLHVDIWIEQDGDVNAIELKYKTRALRAHIGGEHFALRSQSAQDLGRYDFIKDIGRIEDIVADRALRASGYAILLTNDPSYWIQSRNLDTADARFRLHEGNSLHGSLEWGPALPRARGVGEKTCSNSGNPMPCGGRTIRARPLPYTLLLTGLLFTGVFAQVYRYRRVSTRTQRQQTKWVVFGFTAALAGYLGVISLQIAFPGLEPGTLADFLGITTTLCFMLLIPSTIATAILRYRLYDIDIIINRTLVYGALTAILGGFYFGGVTATQALLRVLVSYEQQAQLTVVISTLVIAALFTPLRRRIQAFIDRRFYRRKYDARKTLESFSAQLRNETDLEALSDDLVDVVQEAMQPAHVSLWLRPDRVPKSSGAKRDMRG
jgi:hypothetical protein